ncbi:hypothetical protein Golax_003803, partial [Gossypium laxum]|nr:hypothetical protein [Gossypium laxum]
MSFLSFVTSKLLSSCSQHPVVSIIFQAR